MLIVKEKTFDYYEFVAFSGEWHSQILESFILRDHD